MANKISYRMQTPPNEITGERIDIHPVTTSDEVIVNPDSPDSRTLTETLDKMHPFCLSEDKPDFSCIWAKIIKSE